MTISLDIVIINYFSTDKIAALLANLQQIDLTNIRLQILIVSNSDEEGIRRLANTHPLVIVTINPQNLGFAKACNQALTHCRGDYLLLLNPDTQLFADTLQKAVLFLQAHNDITALGVKHRNEKGITAPACFYFPTLRTYLYDVTGLSKIAPARFKGLLFPSRTDYSGYADHVMGAFLLIRRVFIRQFGFMDERFFLYAEDMDWCKKVWNNKGTVFYNADIAIIHEGGSSTEGKDDNLCICYAMESKLKYAYKHFARWKYYLLLGAVLTVEPVTRLVFAVITANQQNIKGVFSIYSSLLKRRQFK